MKRENIHKKNNKIEKSCSIESWTIVFFFFSSIDINFLLFSSIFFYLHGGVAENAFARLVYLFTWLLYVTSLKVWSQNLTVTDHDAPEEKIHKKVL